jgi:hypothetical protein
MKKWHRTKHKRPEHGTMVLIHPAYHPPNDSNAARLVMIYDGETDKFIYKSFGKFWPIRSGLVKYWCNLPELIK